MRTYFHLCVRFGKALKVCRIAYLSRIIEAMSFWIEKKICYTRVSEAKVWIWVLKLESFVQI